MPPHSSALPSCRSSCDTAPNARITVCGPVPSGPITAPSGSGTPTANACKQEPMGTRAAAEAGARAGGACIAGQEHRDHAADAGLGAWADAQQEAGNACMLLIPCDSTGHSQEMPVPTGQSPGIAFGQQRELEPGAEAPEQPGIVAARPEQHHWQEQQQQQPMLRAQRRVGHPVMRTDLASRLVGSSHSSPIPGERAGAGAAGAGAGTGAGAAAYTAQDSAYLPSGQRGQQQVSVSGVSGRSPMEAGDPRGSREPRLGRKLSHPQLSLAGLSVSIGQEGVAGVMRILAACSVDYDEADAAAAGAADPAFAAEEPSGAASAAARAGGGHRASGAEGTLAEEAMPNSDQLLAQAVLLQIPGSDMDHDDDGLEQR